FRVRGGMLDDRSDSSRSDKQKLSDTDDFFAEFAYLIDNVAPVDKVIILLEQNANKVMLTYHWDGFDYTTLHYVAEKGDEAVLKYLIEDMGVSPDIKTDSSAATALQYAVFESQLGVAQYLIDKGVDVDARDSQQSTMLHYAVVGGHMEAIEYMVQNGYLGMVYETDEKGFNILHMAVVHNDASYVDKLIQLLQQAHVDVARMLRQEIQLAGKSDTPIDLAEQRYRVCDHGLVRSLSDLCNTSS
ncbi:MAG: ankyrin repeat domain-containing protein, partial [Bacteroidota bacterium]